MLEANPFDWQTRLVYSDYLRDGGNEKEANFQKSMAEWYRDKAHKILEKNRLFPEDEAGIIHTFESLPLRIIEDKEYYPEGVNPRQFKWKHHTINPYGNVVPSLKTYQWTNPEEPTSMASESAWHHHESKEPSETFYHGYLNRYAWHTHKDMENAFRKAFNE